MFSIEETHKNGILRIIELYSYDFYLVHPIEEIKCKCINYDTKEANHSCPNCLGTGNRIKIKKIRGAHQETAIPSTARDLKDITMARNYYIPSIQPIQKRDLIVDDNDVFFVHAVQNEVSFHGEKIFQKCLAYSKKMESKILMENFKKIVGDKYVKNKIIKR